MNSAVSSAISRFHRSNVKIIRGSETVQPHSSVADATRSPAWAAVAAAITAPSEYPATWNRSMPSSSSTARPSATS